MNHPPPEATAPHRPRALRRRRAARLIAEHAPETEAEGDFVEHPDGWYWAAPDGRQQFGPFETLSLARADRDRANDESVNLPAAEREAEAALGVEQAVRADGGTAPDDDEEPARGSKDRA